MNGNDPSPDRLVDSNDDRPAGQEQSRPIRSHRLLLGLASLVALMLVSIAFTFAVSPGQPPGRVLALCKVIALGFLFVRVRLADVYTLQWSSMFILLFMAEGVVRTTSDASPSSGLGFAEAVFATLYFVAVLAYLRPLKKAAKRTAGAA